MKKVLLTTTAIVGLTAPAFAADPTAVSDQPYFHHSHPMTWSGGMSIALTNPSASDMDTAVEKSRKRDFYLNQMNAAHATGEENAVALAGMPDADGLTAAHISASQQISAMRVAINAHDSYTLAAITAAGDVSAVEDVIDDFLGGSHSEAMDVLVQSWSHTNTLDGSDAADLAADLQAFADSQDAGTEGVEKTASINTTASLGVSMSAGDGWTATTSGTINLGGGSVAGGTVSLSNGMLSLSVGKTQHAATAAIATVHGMDVALDKNAADTQLQASMALGGATISVDNEMDGDNLETKSQTVGIKGAYGTMSYGLGWQADGDLGFSIGTNLGGIGLTISRVNAGSDYSMGLAAAVDLGGGLKLNASNAQNSDGLQDKSFTYDEISVAADGTHDGSTDYKYDESAYGVAYTVASGVTLYASYSDFTQSGGGGTDVSGTGTTINLEVSF